MHKVDLRQAIPPFIVVFMTPRIFPVIMAGGASSRLWPASGRQKPKWDLRLFPAPGAKQGEPVQSLLEGAWERGRSVAPASQCFVVTGGGQAELVHQSLPELPVTNLLIEPEPRDTSGAVAYAAGAILKMIHALAGQTGDYEDVMFVLPGDQIIHPLSDFTQCVQAGVRVAIEMDALVTFGIIPRKPATAYGYIHRGAELRMQSPLPSPASASIPRAYRVLEFREKPDRATAEQYLASGEYFWNGGIFLWRMRALLAEFERQLPQHAALAKALGSIPKTAAVGGPEWNDVARASFPGLKKISIDFGIMEKARSVATVAADYQWDDIGSWSSVAEHLENASGNAVGPATDLISVDSRSNLVFAPGKRVALIGVEGLAVVESEDEILICKLDRDQDVKKVSETAASQPRK